MQLMSDKILCWTVHDNELLIIIKPRCAIEVSARNLLEIWSKVFIEAYKASRAAAKKFGEAFLTLVRGLVGASRWGC